MLSPAASILLLDSPTDPAARAELRAAGAVDAQDWGVDELLAHYDREVPASRKDAP